MFLTSVQKLADHFKHDLKIKPDDSSEKLTIIKSSGIDKEYKSLNETKKTHLKINADVQNLIEQLKDVNLKLWSIEDEKRICEKNKDFGKEFIELARNVYINNDRRAKIKWEINKLLGSNIKEVKKYANY